MLHIKRENFASNVDTARTAETDVVSVSPWKKEAKCVFPNALQTEHDNYLQSVNHKIDESAELDLRLF